MIKIKRNCKKIERRKLGIKRSSKVRRKFSQPKRGRCENHILLRKNFAAVRCYCENRSPLRNHFAAALHPLRKPFLAHECHFAAGYHRFAAANWLRLFPHLETRLFAAEAPFRRVFHSYETPLWHTSASSQSRAPVSQLQNGLRNRCGISPRCKNA